MAEIPVEYASHRKIRERNKLYYRFNHWPIWIFVFFIAPGPLTFDLFERGFDARMAIWLGVVLLGTGIVNLAIDVTVPRATAKSIEKIEKLGGKVTETAPKADRHFGRVREILMSDGGIGIRPL